jgi:two-component system OmpR family sensor kinase
VDLTGLAAEECARHDAELDVAAADAEVMLTGVPRLLRRLIRNLLENARRYADGEVRVKCAP